MSIPLLLKAEAKLTTSTAVQVAARELEALRPDDGATTGLLAVLFWCGDREVDGRWILVDASELRAPHGETLSLTKAALVAAARAQPWLAALRRHVDEGWPAFLEAFRDDALRGHAELVAELAQAHAERTTGARLPDHRVLDAEHRASIRALIDAHGESGAGRIAQDLLAYLLASAGYRQVTNNPVGVPDFVLADLERGRRPASVVLEVTRHEAERLVALCRSAGEEHLAIAVTRQLDPAARRRVAAE